MISILSKSGSANIEVGADLTDIRSGFLGRVLISRGFHRLLPIDRAAVMAEVVERSLIPLAESEGWLHSLERAMRRVGHDDFVCVWESPWKRTPDLRHQVRIKVWVADDGYGRWRVQVANLENDVLRQTPEILGWTWVDNFVRMAKQMRF